MDSDSAYRTPLAVYRFAAGLSQKELAERAGISRSGLAYIETARHGPRAITARAIADALGVSVAELFPEIDDTKSTDDGKGPA